MVDNYDVSNLQKTQFKFSVPTMLKTSHHLYIIVLNMAYCQNNNNNANDQNLFTWHHISFHLNTFLKTYMVESN